MANEVFSVKVSEELKDRIKTLIDGSGMQGKDFMDEIIRLYELNSAKDIMPSAVGDVEELQAVTRRINDIFTGLIERSSNLMKDKEGTLRDEIEKKNRSITLVQEKLDKALEDLACFRTENDNVNKRYQEIKDVVALSDARMQEQDKNHRSLLDSKEELIQEYKGKNDALNGVILEYQEYREKNKALATDVEKMKHEVDVMKAKLTEKTAVEEKLEAEIVALKGQNEVAILKVEMEKERALLELREKHQSKIEELNNDYGAKVGEYNSKVRTLLDEMEHVRSEHKKEKDHKDVKKG